MMVLPVVCRKEGNVYDDIACGESKRGSAFHYGATPALLSVDELRRWAYNRPDFNHFVYRI